MTIFILRMIPRIGGMTSVLRLGPYTCVWHYVLSIQRILISHGNKRQIVSTDQALYYVYYKQNES